MDPLTRIDAVASALSALNLEAMIVSNPSNIRYLTGFSGSNGTLLIIDAEATLFTDNRYAERAREELDAARSAVQLVIAPDVARPQVVERLRGVAKVGIEADHVTWSGAKVMFADLGESRVVATNGLIESLREVKDDTELELLRRAASIADAALSEFLADFGPGETERDVARRLDHLILDGGADGSAFETIVASGPNSSRPHHQATNRQLATGDLVIIDLGAQYHGYRSDMTRSFVLGEPTERQRDLLDGVRSSQQAGIDAISAGVLASNIDGVCRSHLHESGLGEWFTHGTGHGVGLDIHEAPSVSAKGTATLAPGHVITVEPGAYIPGFGGVRWEDTVVVTALGSEPLTRSAKQPVVN